MPGGPYPAYLDGLFGDPEVEAALSAEAHLRAMIRVEIALAEAQAALGLIPERAAEAIAGLAAQPVPAAEDLAAATLRDGVVVPGLVAELRRRLPDEHAPWLHHGATSQDIADTATCLVLGSVLDTLTARLFAAMARLSELAEGHRRSVTVARTRGQQAVPTTVGLKAAGWLAPLVRITRRLPAIRAEALTLSLGGAGGTQAALGPRAAEIEEKMAERLGLSVAPMPWHAQRDGFVAIGGWMASVAAALGKTAGDILQMCRTEVGEARLAGAGGSSTMPNKANPTRAETVVALARLASHHQATLQQAQMHGEERDGAAWQIEWAALPALAVTTGAALRHADAMLAALEIDRAGLEAGLADTRQLILAEAASFALAEHMPRTDAQALVKEACRAVLDTGRGLIDVLEAGCTAPVDWDRLRDMGRQVGRSDALIDRVLAEYRTLKQDHERIAP